MPPLLAPITLVVSSPTTVAGNGDSVNSELPSFESIKAILTG